MKEAKVMPNRNATAAVIGVGDYIGAAIAKKFAGSRAMHGVSSMRFVRSARSGRRR
jgi:NAD(P)-dependent dehydrogenase (short-subunit alcohol dehydrogenase family)